MMMLDKNHYLSTAICSVSRDLYMNMQEFKKEHPKGEYKIVYLILNADGKTSAELDEYDWFSTPEEAIEAWSKLETRIRDLDTGDFFKTTYGKGENNNKTFVKISDKDVFSLTDNRIFHLVSDSVDTGTTICEYYKCIKLEPPNLHDLEETCN